MRYWWVVGENSTAFPALNVEEFWNNDREMAWRLLGMLVLGGIGSILGTGLPSGPYASIRRTDHQR